MTWEVEVLGGPFDGAAVERLEDPPDRLLVGTCHGELCGRPVAHVQHVAWWLPVEAHIAPLDAAEYVRVALALDGRAVYLVDDPDA